MGEDYDFKGWASISNATGPDYIVDEENNKVTPATFIITSNVTLYAVWEIRPVSPLHTTLTIPTMWWVLVVCLRILTITT